MERNSAVAILLCAGLFIFAIAAMQESFLVAAIGCGLFGGAMSIVAIDFLTTLEEPKKPVTQEVVTNENAYIPLKV